MRRDFGTAIFLVITTASLCQDSNPPALGINKPSLSFSFCFVFHTARRHLNTRPTLSLTKTNQTMTPRPPPAAGLQRAPLDVYKKITVIREKTDSVTFEDSQGQLQHIKDLGEEALSAVSTFLARYLLMFHETNLTFSNLSHRRHLFNQKSN